MASRNQKVALGLTGVLALGFAAYVAFYVPTGWKSVALGMPRTEVVTLLGEPDFDSGDIKGCFWFWGMTPVRFELNVLFNSIQNAESIRVNQYLGPKDGSYVRRIHYESQAGT